MTTKEESFAPSAGDTCPWCNGSGVVVDEACESCGGEGLLYKPPSPPPAPPLPEVERSGLEGVVVPKELDTHGPLVTIANKINSAIVQGYDKPWYWGLDLAKDGYRVGYAAAASYFERESQRAAELKKQLFEADERLDVWVDIANTAETQLAASERRCKRMSDALSEIVKDDGQNEWEEEAMRMHKIALEALREAGNV